MSDISQDQAQAALKEFNNMQNGGSEPLCAMIKALEVYESTKPDSTEFLKLVEKLAQFACWVKDDYKANGYNDSVLVVDIESLIEKSKELGLLKQ